VLVMISIMKKWNLVMTYRYEPSWPVIPWVVCQRNCSGSSVNRRDYTRNQRDFALAVHLRRWEIKLCEGRHGFWDGHERTDGGAGAKM
jgi:hypothetical protein